MQKYEIDGKIYEASSPDEAYAMADAGSNDPTEGMSTFEKTMAGIGRGMHNVYQQGGNILGLIPDEELAESKRLDEALLDTTAGAVGNFLGESVAALPVGGAVGAAVKPVAGLAGPLAGRIGGYAAEGAAEGALLGGPDNRLEGAGIGAATSAGIGGTLDKVLGGVKPSANAQTLLDEGVDLTPGQINPGGIMSSIEESAFSQKAFPRIEDARKTAELGQYGAMINRSLPPGADKVDVSQMDKMLDDLYKKFNANYEKIKGFDANTMGMEMQMSQRIKNAPIEDSLEQAEQKWIKNKMSKYEEMTTTDLQNLRHDIRTRSRNKYRKQDFDGVELLGDMEAIVTDRMNRALPKELRKLLKETDAQYGNYKIVEDIAFRSGDTGAPTPFKASQAVKMAQQSKGQYARGGGGPLRELTKAGADVFATGTPKTGMSLGVPLMGGIAGSAIGGPTGAAAGAGAPSIAALLLSSTKTGRNAFKGNTTIQQALKKKPFMGDLFRTLGVVGVVEEDQLE